MSNKDEYKQKFRPQDATLDQEVDAALAGVSLEELYGAAAAQQAAEQPAAAQAPDTLKGTRRGRIISVDPAKDEVFVDLGGKSQGVAAYSQF
ncbi:MAG TPA: hypothetical protein VNL70_00190, partial [Tepidisphaeraceae bacterium]|nr:hypothetical protein [Tepidisphaeraceae bacterium]